MPKDFSADGASGGWGGNGGTAPATGSSTGGYQANDWSSNRTATPSNAFNSSSGGYHTGDMTPFGVLGPVLSSKTVTRNPDGTDVTTDNLTGQNWASTGDDLAMGLHFADGGEVPDDGGSQSGDIGDLLAMALSSVDQGLDYGRKKHGLMQSADASTARTPMIPGTQSESGIPRPQPMPGPLPPTSNPFGKRRQFGQNDNEGQEQDTAQAGAIPDNEEDTETA